MVEVSEDQAVQSWASLVWPDKMPTPEIVPGDQAVLLGAGSSDLVRGVRMIRPKGEPINDDDKALRAAEAAVRAGGSGWVELSPDKPAHFLVAIKPEDDTYEICDKDGVPIKNLRPPLKADDPASAAKVVSRLVHLAKYRATQELENFDATSPLCGKLVVEWIGWQDKYVKGRRPTPQPFDVREGRIPTLKAGQTAWLRIRNDFTRDLNIVVLDLESNWAITQTYPQNGDFEVVSKQSELLAPFGLPLTASLPDGYDEGYDTAQGPGGNRPAELPRLDAARTRRADPQEQERFGYTGRPAERPRSAPRLGHRRPACHADVDPGHIRERRMDDGPGPDPHREVNRIGRLLGRARDPCVPRIVRRRCYHPHLCRKQYFGAMSKTGVPTAKVDPVTTGVVGIVVTTGTRTVWVPVVVGWVGVVVPTGVWLLVVVAGGWPEPPKPSGVGMAGAAAEA